MERFTHAAAAYAQHRPAPPAVMADLLCALAKCARPGLVVDLGSGTGLSTRYWSERAERVIGIEPNAAMRGLAVAAPRVEYCAGEASHTGQGDACADIVTCAQALHWLEPSTTFAEAARVLRPGGVFAAYDYDWPPETGIWELDRAYAEVDRITRAREKDPGKNRWSKSMHAARMRDSGRFRFVHEIRLHEPDHGTPRRLWGCLLSQSHVANLLAEGHTHEELGLEAFRAELSLHDSASRPWLWSYTVRYGIV